MEHLLSHGLCHERVVIRVRIYVPIAVDAYVLDVGRFGRLSRANERRDSNRRHEPSLSTSIVQAAAGRCHRCGRALRCAPPPSASCPACTGENAECRADWRELEFHKVENFSDLPIPFRVKFPGRARVPACPFKVSLNMIHPPPLSESLASNPADPLYFLLLTLLLFITAGPM